MDIQNSNYGYIKIDLCISKNLYWFNNFFSADFQSHLNQCKSVTFPGSATFSMTLLAVWSPTIRVICRSENKKQKALSTFRFRAILLHLTHSPKINTGFFDQLSITRRNGNCIPPHTKSSSPQKLHYFSSLCNTSLITSIFQVTNCIHLRNTPPRTCIFQFLNALLSWVTNTEVILLCSYTLTHSPKINTGFIDQLSVTRKQWKLQPSTYKK